MTDSATENKADFHTPDGSNTSASRLSESTCHILPCNVDFEGMAKTHVFFNPVQVEDGVIASSFRGRGLLSMQDEDCEDGKHYPMLLSLDDDNQIQTKVAIDNFVEWHHEHSIKSLQYKDRETSRVQVAKEWMELSSSLHDPLPVEK